MQPRCINKTNGKTNRDNSYQHFNSTGKIKFQIRITFIIIINTNGDCIIVITCIHMHTCVRSVSVCQDFTEYKIVRISVTADFSDYRERSNAKVFPSTMVFFCHDLFRK